MEGRSRIHCQLVSPTDPKQTVITRRMPWYANCAVWRCGSNIGVGLPSLVGQRKGKCSRRVFVTGKIRPRYAHHRLRACPAACHPRSKYFEGVERQQHSGSRRSSTRGLPGKLRCHLACCDVVARFATPDAEPLGPL